MPSRICARCNNAFEPPTKLKTIKDGKNTEDIVVLDGPTMFCARCLRAMHKPDPYAEAKQRQRARKNGVLDEGPLPEDVRRRWGLLP